MLRKIGKYNIQAEIGRGGFGKVYRAFDPTVNRTVAIKVLTSEGDTELLHRFQNEAAAAGNLHHRNIITIHEFGDENGVPYMVMEFLEGKDLHQTLNGGEVLTLLQKMQIMSQVAEGLLCAHRKGVIHRDVKPANIMLLPDGTVKIMDFGIARLTQSNATRQTRAGFLIGTIEYMCPEQFQGMQADALCDLWAFGAIYYQLLTNRQPFRGPDVVKLMYQITSVEPEPIRSLNPECPEALEQMIHRSLSKDRSLRYQSLEDFQFDVEPILLSLQQNFAKELLAQAQNQFAEGEFENAQRTVRQILELDGSNREARQLRLSISRQLDQLSLRAKAKVLVDKAEEELKVNRYSEAIEFLQSAVGLDPKDTGAAAKLGRARTLKETAERTEFLLLEAHQSFAKQDLTGAWKSVNEALSISPDNRNAFELSDQVGSEINKRKKEELFQEELQKIRGFLLVGEFQEAIGCLDQLKRDGSVAADVEDLLKRAWDQKAAAERAERLACEQSEIKELLRQMRVKEAIERIEAACTEFPENNDLPVLLRHTREELHSREQAERKSKLKQDAEALLADGKFLDAVPLLEEGLNAFSGDLDLIHLLQTALKNKAASEREERIQYIVVSGEDLRVAGQFSEAFQLVETSRRELGDDTRLIDLNKILQGDWERQKREDAIRNAAQNVQQLIEQGRPNSALIMIHQIAERYPGDPQIASLLARAEEELLRHERNQNRDRLLVEAATLADAFEFDRALQVLARGFKEFPNEAALLEAEKSIRAKKAEFERQRSVDTVLRKAQALQTEQNFSMAVEVLREGIEKCGEDPALANLMAKVAGELEAWKRAKSIKDIEIRARQFMDASDFAGATDFLRPRVAEFRGEESLARMGKEAEDKLRAQKDRKFVREQIAHAEELENKGRPAEALVLLEKGLEQLPKERELSRAVQRLREQIETTARLEKLAKYCAKIEAKVGQADWPGARAAILEARAECGADSRFDEFEEVAAIEQKKLHQQRLRRLADLLGRAAQLEEKGDLKSAHRLMDEGLSEYPDAKELLEGRARLRSAISVAERTEGIANKKALIEIRLSNREFDAALEIIAAAQREFKGEPAFQRLLDSTREAKRLHSLAGLIVKITERKAAGDLDNATKLLDTGLKEFPKEPRLLKIKEEVSWERFRISTVEKAKEFISRGQLDKAEKALRGVLAKRPDDLECSALMNAIKENQAQRKEFTASEKKKEPRAASFTRRQMTLAGAAVVCIGLVIGAVMYWPKGATGGTEPGDTSQAIKTSSLTAARVGVAYDQRISLEGGGAPHTFQFSSGQIPPGLFLERNGRIRGTPWKEGLYEFRANITDSMGSKSQQAFTLYTASGVDVGAREKPVVPVKETPKPTPGTLASTPKPSVVRPTPPAENPKPEETKQAKVEKPVEAPTPVPVNPAPAAPAARPFVLETYGGVRSSSFRWTNSSGVGGRVTIDGRTAMPGSVSGRFPEPGIPFRITKTTPPVKIEQQPAPGNPKLVFQADSDLKQVVIEWSVYQP